MPCRLQSQSRVLLPKSKEADVDKSRLRALAGGVISATVIFASIRGEISFAVIMFLVGSVFACSAGRGAYKNRENSN